MAMKEDLTEFRK